MDCELKDETLIPWALNREFDGVWEKRKLDVVYDTLKVVIAGVAVAASRFDSVRHAWRPRSRPPAMIAFYCGVGGYASAQVVARARARPRVVGPAQDPPPRRPGVDRTACLRGVRRRAAVGVLRWPRRQKSPTRLIQEDGPAKNGPVPG